MPSQCHVLMFNLHGFWEFFSGLVFKHPVESALGEGKVSHSQLSLRTGSVWVLARSDNPIDL